VVNQAVAIDTAVGKDRENSGLASKTGKEFLQIPYQRYANGSHCQRRLQNPFFHLFNANATPLTTIAEKFNLISQSDNTFLTLLSS
jgi:hypothetical protein